MLFSLKKNGSFQVVSYAYLIASNIDIGGGSNYVNETTLPSNDALELVMWQAHKQPYTPDETFPHLPSHPAVVSSLGAFDNITYLGYAARCPFNSSVGFADLDAATRTYLGFTPAIAMGGDDSLLGYYELNQYPGVMAIQSLVNSAFTTTVLSCFGSPVCSGDGTGSVDCNPWYCVNAATGGIYVPVHRPDDPSAVNLQFPTISPARMNLAMYKLLGEGAIAMMTSGGGS